MHGSCLLCSDEVAVVNKFACGDSVKKMVARVLKAAGCISASVCTPKAKCWPFMASALKASVLELEQNVKNNCGQIPFLHW